jgi:hypothetical protein
MGAFGIGQPLSRFEDERLPRGGGTSVADRALAGQAHACFLRSPHRMLRSRRSNLKMPATLPASSASSPPPTWRRMVRAARLSPANDRAQTARRCSGGLIQVLQRHASDTSEILSRWLWSSLWIRPRMPWN